MRCLQISAGNRLQNLFNRLKSVQAENVPPNHAILPDAFVTSHELVVNFKAVHPVPAFKTFQSTQLVDDSVRYPLVSQQIVDFRQHAPNYRRSVRVNHICQFVNDIFDWRPDLQGPWAQSGVEECHHTTQTCSKRCLKNAFFFVERDFYPIERPHGFSSSTAFYKTERERDRIVLGQVRLTDVSCAGFFLILNSFHRI